jgi:hypothetical protein
MGSVKDIAGGGVGKEMNRGVKIGSERKQGPQGRKKGTGRRLHTREFFEGIFCKTECDCSAKSEMQGRRGLGREMKDGKRGGRKDVVVYPKAKQCEQSSSVLIDLWRRERGTGKGREDLT